MTTYHKGQIVEVTAGKRAGQCHPVVDVYGGSDDPEFPARPGVSIWDEGEATELFYGLDEVRAAPFTSPAPKGGVEP